MSTTSRASILTSFAIFSIAQAASAEPPLRTEWEQFTSDLDGDTYFISPDQLEYAKNQFQRRSRSKVPYIEVWTRRILARADTLSTRATETRFHILCDDRLVMLGSIRAYDENAEQIWRDHRTGYHKRKNYEPVISGTVMDALLDRVCDT